MLEKTFWIHDKTKHAAILQSEFNDFFLLTLKTSFLMYNNNKIMNENYKFFNFHFLGR